MRWTVPLHVNIYIEFYSTCTFYLQRFWLHKIWLRTVIKKLISHNTNNDCREVKTRMGNWIYLSSVRKIMISNEVFFSFFFFFPLFNYAEFRRCSLILFPNGPMVAVLLFLLEFLFSFGASSIVLPYDIPCICCLAWFNLSSFWSFFSLENLFQKLLDFLTSLMSFKIALVSPFEMTHFTLPLR